MIYAEFIARDPAMPVEIFRRLGNQASDWAEGAADRMILQLGRTLGLGPAPSHLCLWEIPSPARLDDWEAYFRSPAAQRNARSLAMHRAIQIRRAGLYDALDRAPSLQAPLTLVEYIEPQGEPDEAVLAAMAARAARHRAVRPLLLLRRVGRAGPDPALLAFWGAPGFAGLEPMLRDAAPGRLRPREIGLYRPFGTEVL
ncbi:MAG: hypothetical protein U1E53_04340 [Dongiaceae bacterium]